MRRILKLLALFILLLVFSPIHGEQFVTSQEELNRCEKSFEDAENCCGKNVEQCLKEDTSGKYVIMFKEALDMFQQTQLFQKQGNMKAACVLMNRSQNMNITLSSFAYSKCKSKRKACVQSCTNSQNAAIDSKQIAFSQQYVKDCQGMKVQAQDILGVALQAFVAYKTIKETCVDPANEIADLKDFDFNPNGNPDCSNAANYNHPTCQAEFCAGSGAINNPKCLTRDIAKKSDEDIFGEGAENGSTLPSLGEELEGLSEDDIVAEENNSIGSNLAQGNSRGGAGLPAASGGSGLDPLPGAPAAPGEFKSGFMKDLGGRKGFSSAGGQWKASSGGGGYTYSRGQRRLGREGNKKFKSFNLKSLMDKDKKKPRGVASAKNAGRGQEIGARHDDIWKRMSRRYLQICLKKRLWHCDKMKFR